MPKTVTAEPSTSQPEGTKRQRKKLAKQEARVMLKIEQTKKDVKKAQKKFTRAQSNLDENQTHLHELEEKLQQIRTVREPQTLVSQTPPDTSSETQPEAVPTPEVINEVYQEPLLVSDAPAPEADTAPEEQPLTQAESDVTSYPASEQNTPSPEAITKTDTTTPEDTTVNGNRALSPNKVQSLVEHGNEEPELSTTPAASAQEEPTPENTGV